jgi:hypothetical protein
MSSETSELAGDRSPPEFADCHSTDGSALASELLWVAVKRVI